MWRQLISGARIDDAAQRQRNPGLQNLKALLGHAMAEKSKQKAFGLEMAGKKELATFEEALPSTMARTDYYKAAAEGKVSTDTFAWNSKRTQLYQDVESGIITQEQADAALGQDIDSDDDLSFEDKERIKLGMRREENVLDLFESDGGYIDSVRFNDKEKKAVEYMLESYNKIRKRGGDAELELIEKGGPFRINYWELEEVEGQETPMEAPVGEPAGEVNQMGAIQERNGGQYMRGSDNNWHLLAE